MDNSDSGPMNIAKIVINNQTTTEPFKSSPLKTYSKKSPDTNEAKSRYGRTQKRNFDSDFLSTDKHLSQYFKAGLVSRKFFYASNAKDTGSPAKYSSPHSSEKKGRGRPRKSLPAIVKPTPTETVVSQNLNTSLPTQLSDYQAPAPTSTETLPVPAELDRNTNAAPVEPVEECHDADWNVGDLCWACIDGWPYWPGVVTRDPTNGQFRKTKVFGRCPSPLVMLHVTFFGDNGLRSWVKINKIMTFSGLDDYQNLVADFCGPDAKNKDPSLARMYMVGQTRMKKWQAAVSEAESFLSESRQERVKYLQNLYPTLQPGQSPQKPAEVPASPKEKGRKRKQDEVTPLASSSNVSSSPSLPPPAKRQTIYSPKSSKEIVNDTTQESTTDGTSEEGNGPVKVTPLKLIPVEKVPPTAKPILLKGRLPGINSGNPVVIKEASEGEEGSVKTLIVEDGKQTYKVRLMRATDLPSRVLASVIKPEPGPPITPRAIYRKDETPKKSTKAVTPKAVTPKATTLKGAFSSPSPVDNGEIFTPKRGRGRPRKSEPLSTPLKRPAEPESPNLKGKRGRPPKKPCLTDDQAPAVSSPKVENKQEPKEKVTVTNNSRPIRKKSKSNKRSFQAYCDQHFDRAVEENPDLSKADVEKYLEKRWSEMTADARSKYKSRLMDESEESEDSSIITEDSEDKAPLAAPTVKTYRRTQHLFSGIKNDKVCQVCLKGSETGEEVIRCRGPCNGVFHSTCGENRPPKELFIPAPPAVLVTPVKKKMGRPKKGNSPPTGKDTPHHSQKSPARKAEETNLNGRVRGYSKSPKKTKAEESGSAEQAGDLGAIKTDRKEESYRIKSTEKVKESVITCDKKTEPLNKTEGSQVTEKPAEEGPSESIKPATDDDGKSSEDGTSKVPKSRKNGRKKSADDKESSENGKETKWMCGLCSQNKEDPCFVCCEYTSEPTYRCSIATCGKMYHEACKEEWPQQRMNGQQAFMCPQHACHTCISDDPKAHLPKFAGDKLVRCLHCPSAFHHNNWCIPAGTNLLSMTQLICPRHYKGQSKKVQHHVNTSWCQICSIGGSLICCDDCPNSFHPECLKITPPQGRFICEDCETGRYPLYGEIVWVKLGAYRWWPARILFPSEIPDNINKLEHELGMFVVKFFGSHDHYWVNRGRTFLFHEGDGEEVKGRSALDNVFNLAMKEAAIAFQNQEKERCDREAGASVVHKPPKFVKITVNKPTGKVKPPYSIEVPNRCECTPEMANPCGETSDCINRMLYVECSPDVCPAKEKCQNQKFERKEYPPLVPFKTANRGWGLKVLVPLKKGDFVIEYVGEIIDTVEYNKRLCAKQRTKDGNYYFLNIDKDTMIDAGPKGNKARFVNHSCEPNCETQKWTVNGITRIGIFTIKDIPRDTELVFNYKLETIGDTLVECKCGALKCTGYIGGKPAQSKSNGSERKAASLEGPPRAPRVRSRGGARPRVPRPRQTEKVTEDACFTCGEGGELLLCDSASCPKGYHLSCLGLTKQPPGGWVCPWHQCSVCSAAKVQRCALCINSYCSQHASGNISLDSRRGVLVCINHAHDSDSGSDSEIERKPKLKSPSRLKVKNASKLVSGRDKAKEVIPPSQLEKAKDNSTIQVKTGVPEIKDAVKPSNAVEGKISATSNRTPQASRSTPSRAVSKVKADAKASVPHKTEDVEMKLLEMCSEEEPKTSTKVVKTSAKEVGTTESDPTEKALSKILGEEESGNVKKSVAEDKKDPLLKSKPSLPDKPDSRTTRTRSLSEMLDKPKSKEVEEKTDSEVKGTRSRMSSSKHSTDETATSKFEELKADCKKLEEALTNSEKQVEQTDDVEKAEDPKASRASRTSRSRFSSLSKAAIDKPMHSKIITLKPESDVKVSESGASRESVAEETKVSSPSKTTRAKIEKPENTSGGATKSSDSKRLEETEVEEPSVLEKHKPSIVPYSRSSRSSSRSSDQSGDTKKEAELELKSSTSKLDNSAKTHPKDRKERSTPSKGSSDVLKSEESSVKSGDSKSTPVTVEPKKSVISEIADRVSKITSSGFKTNDSSVPTKESEKSSNPNSLNLKPSGEDGSATTESVEKVKKDSTSVSETKEGLVKKTVPLLTRAAKQQEIKTPFVSNKTRETVDEKKTEEATQLSKDTTSETLDSATKLVNTQIGGERDLKTDNKNKSNERVSGSTGSKSTAGDNDEPNDEKTKVEVKIESTEDSKVNEAHENAKSCSMVLPEVVQNREESLSSFSEDSLHMRVKRVTRSYSRSPKKLKPEVKDSMPLLVEVPSCPSSEQSTGKSEVKPTSQSGQLNIEDMIVVFDEIPDDAAPEGDSTAIKVNGH